VGSDGTLGGGGSAAAGWPFAGGRSSSTATGGAAWTAAMPQIVIIVTEAKTALRDTMTAISSSRRIKSIARQTQDGVKESTNSVPSF
jgi:hypothetical protein